jgi:hypothetical protein
VIVELVAAKRHGHGLFVGVPVENREGDADTLDVIDDVDVIVAVAEREMVVEAVELAVGVKVTEADSDGDVDATWLKERENDGVILAVRDGESVVEGEYEADRVMEGVTICESVCDWLPDWLGEADCEFDTNWLVDLVML